MYDSLPYIFLSKILINNDCVFGTDVVILQPKLKDALFMWKKLFVFSLVLSLVLQAYAQKQDDMRSAVEYLASQELGGRFPATAGDTLASEFIAGKLRGMKLKPVVRGKKKKGFYHDFTFQKKEKTMTTHNIIAVIPGKDKRLKHEYIVVGNMLLLLSWKRYCQQGWHTED